MALELLLLGGLFLRLLVANWSDNAYLGLALIGVALVFASSPFALAAVLPNRLLRRIVLRFAVGLLAVVALVSGVILIGSLLAIPSQHYRYDHRVFGRHLLGLLVLLPAVAGAFVLLFHRHRD